MGNPAIETLGESIRAEIDAAKAAAQSAAAHAARVGQLLNEGEGSGRTDMEVPTMGSYKGAKGLEQLLERTIHALHRFQDDLGRSDWKQAAEHEKADWRKARARCHRAREALGKVAESIRPVE